MEGCKSTSHENGVYIIENNTFNNGWNVSFDLECGSDRSDLVTVYTQYAELLPTQY